MYFWDWDCEFLWATATDIFSGDDDETGEIRQAPCSSSLFIIKVSGEGKIIVEGGGEKKGKTEK